MNTIKINRTEKGLTLLLPPELSQKLDLEDGEEFTIEIEDDRIILIRQPVDVREAWAAYQAIEPRYQNANRKLGE